MKAYTTIMGAYGRQVGIDFKFGGMVANTMQAHRVLQWAQERGSGEEVVNSLYHQYFEEERHPSSKETLLKACLDAGIDKGEAEAFIADENEGLMDVKALVREQESNGVDSVPYIVFEGKRRDFTLVGAKEIDEYVKTLEQVMKESL